MLIYCRQLKKKTQKNKHALFLIKAHIAQALGLIKKTIVSIICQR